MPVPLLVDIAARYLPSDYYGTLIYSAAAIGAVHYWASGPSLLEREARLEALQVRARGDGKKIHVTAGLQTMGGRTGSLTPLALVIIASLAHQGAHIIALVPDLNAPEVEQLISLLRESTRNEFIYAETCDMGSLGSISKFADRWNAGSVQGSSAPGTATGAPMAKAPNATQKDKLGDIKAAMSPLQQNTAQVHRLDTIFFLPTDEAIYKIGSQYERSSNVYQISGECVERVYMYEVLGRFHLVNSLLPSLLLMPPNRDIRIVSVISPWYAAGLRKFDQLSEPLAKESSRIYQPWTVLGAAALRWAVLASELQRRLDLLSEADTRPRSKLPGIDSDDVTSVPVGALNSTKQRSHISSILVCPGFERHSQLGAFFGTVSLTGLDALLSCLLWILFIILCPIFWVFGKSTSKAADAIEWAATARLASFSLSAPTESARDDFLSNERSVKSLKEWTGIQPGKLYREGRVVVRPLPNRFQDASSAANLWNETEEQVKKVIGKFSGSVTE